MNNYQAAALYSAEQVQELERRAIEDHAIPGISLMERAGRAAFDALRQRWPEARKLLVLAGAGNNAGDGFVIATLARQAGLAARVMTLADPQGLQGEALEAWWQMQAAEVHGERFNPELFGWADVVVDAMLGTGLRGKVRAPYKAAVAALNASDSMVMAVDIPSGLAAATGQPLGCCVRADLTVSFIGLKQGLFLACGPEFCGEVVFDDLGVPRAVYRDMQVGARLLGFEQQLAELPPRRHGAHKGDFGHVLVIGGVAGFGGAVRLAAEAALRSGAGLVSVATDAAHAAQLTSQRPELMCHAVADRGALEPLLERASVVVLGPGLGQDAWGHGLWDGAMYSGLPMVVDADALNLLARIGDPPGQDHQQRVLTPHPGEAARLLDSAVASLEADRVAAVSALQQRFGGVVALKGAGTLVAADDGTGLCTAGNPGMASGGMGDLLSGLIGGLMAQGLSAVNAARLGVCAHAVAGDAAAADGQRGMLASDLLPSLRRLLNVQSRG